jgi:hypothetical protein
MLRVDPEPHRDLDGFVELRERDGLDEPDGGRHVVRLRPVDLREGCVEFLPWLIVFPTP